MILVESYDLILYHNEFSSQNYGVTKFLAQTISSHVTWLPKNIFFPLPIFHLISEGTAKRGFKHFFLLQAWWEHEIVASSSVAPTMLSPEYWTEIPMSSEFQAILVLFFYRAYPNFFLFFFKFQRLFGTSMHIQYLTFAAIYSSSD